jgi:hypothetical protein
MPPPLQFAVDDSRTSYFRNAPAPIPMMYSINPFINGPYYQQQPILSSWPYPVYKSTEDIEGPNSRQQQIACGDGPSSPPEKSIPTVSIVGGSEATPNSWPFVVSVDPFLTKRFDESIIINKQTLIKNSCSYRWV